MTGRFEPFPGATGRGGRRQIRRNVFQSIYKVCRRRIGAESSQWEPACPGEPWEPWEPTAADGNPCKTEEGNPGIARGNPGDFFCLTSHQPFLYWRALSLSCSHVVVDFFAWEVRGRLIAIPVVLFMFNVGAIFPYLATRPLPSLSVADLQVSCFPIIPEHQCHLFTTIDVGPACSCCGTRGCPQCLHCTHAASATPRPHVKYIIAFFIDVLHIFHRFCLHRTLKQSPFSFVPVLKRSPAMPDSIEVHLELPPPHPVVIKSLFS